VSDLILGKKLDNELPIPNSARSARINIKARRTEKMPKSETVNVRNNRIVNKDAEIEKMIFPLVTIYVSFAVFE